MSRGGRAARDIKARFETSGLQASTPGASGTRRLAILRRRRTEICSGEAEARWPRNLVAASLVCHLGSAMASNSAGSASLTALRFSVDIMARPAASAAARTEASCGQGRKGRRGQAGG